MRIQNKGIISKLFCNHDYKNFETPINKIINPLGFVALNDNGIWVCVKCGKRK